MMADMKIIAEIFSSNWETYKEFYKDAITSIYLQDGKIISQNDISYRPIVIPGNTIQAQRNSHSNHSRSILVYEIDKLGTEHPKFLIGVSNTGFDEDKKKEGGKYVYGQGGWHSNTYLIQGIHKIFERYYKTKETAPDLKLYFYLLDTKGHKKKSYPNALSNILTYRMLQTLGFDIINIGDINFSKWKEIEPNICLKKTNIGYSSFNKLINDISYISHKNKGNKPAYVKCYNDNPDQPKYVYTFKALGANAYDSFLVVWTLSKLAVREGKLLEFLFAPEKYNFRLGQKNTAETKDFPEPIKKLLDIIGLHITYESTNEIRQHLDREKAQYETAKEEKNIRNQEYFKNNLREKGVLVKCCLCGCEIESILEAAHLWGVSEISNASEEVINAAFDACGVDYDSDQYADDVFFKKYILANSGDNGIWLCRNHHGLFDRNHFAFDEQDGVLITQTDDTVKEFIDTTSPHKNIPAFVLTPATRIFLQYANRTRLRVSVE